MIWAAPNEVIKELTSEGTLIAVPAVNQGSTFLFSSMNNRAIGIQVFVREGSKGMERVFQAAKETAKAQRVDY